MLKYFFITVCCFFIYQNAEAQKADTLLYYMKNSGGMVSTKDSADYFLLIMPPDSNSNQMYRIEEYYSNRKPKFLCTSLNAKYSNLMFNGPAISFYPNGRKKSFSKYTNGQLLGEETSYYSNGKLHYIIFHMPYMNIKYVECRDSTGTVLTTNGNGKWEDIDDQNIIIHQGNVVDSLKDGVWQGTIDDTAKYSMTYKKGKPGAGIGYDSSGKAYPFENMEVQASFKGKGKETYSDFLQKNLVVPKIDRENGVGGRVIITFIVEIDGKPDGFKVVRTPDESLANDSIRTISLSTWNPALRYGMPVRSYFTLPINFTVTNRR